MQEQDFKFCVDGHEFPDEESSLLGDGMFPPFRIFDVDKQDYVGQSFNIREDAELFCQDLNQNLKN